MKDLDCKINVDRFDICGVEAYKAWSEAFPHHAEYSKDPVECYNYFLMYIKEEIEKINQKGGVIFPLIE